MPEDIAIASFDGSSEAEYAWPGLTTFRQPIDAMARSAVTRLLATDRDHSHELFPGELVLRRSCGCPDAAD